LILSNYPSVLSNFTRAKKREWDRNRSFVRIRFRRPTSAQLRGL